MVLGFAKKPILLLICAALVFSAGNAQYNSGPNNPQGYGYNQPGQQQGTEYAVQQGQQQYNQPGQQQQPMQQQGGGYSSGMAIAPTGFASSVGGFESYRLPFERGIRTGDPASFASHLLFVSFRIALAKNKERFNLDEKCQTEAGEKEVADLLVSYYNQSGGKDLAGRILDNRELMLTDLCSEDACSKQFSSDDFVRNAPPEVRDAIKRKPSLKFDATTPAAELKTKIKGICETVVESEFSKRQTQMEKQITQIASQFSQQCARAEQQKQQMEQQQQQWEQQRQQQWQNQPQGGSGQQGPPPQCEFGWNMNNGYYQCNSTPSGRGGGGSGQGPYCGDGVCNEAPETCMDDCQQGGGGGGSGPICGNGNCESGEDSSNCSADCGQPAPVCGNGTCETGEDGTSCPTDCSGGGLASNVLNKMFGNQLYSFTALVNLLRLQENGYSPPPGGEGGYGAPGDNYGSLPSGYTGEPGYPPRGENYGPGGSMPPEYNCPPGEYPDPSRAGNCIRPNYGQNGYNQPPQGQGDGYGGYNQPLQQQGGYNLPPQGGGYGGGGGMGAPQGGGFGGPGFGDFEEMCDNPEEKIREQFSGEMDGMKKEMSERCDDEAVRRTSEILGMAEQQLLGRAECEADTAEMCSEATAIVAALEKALSNIQEPANQIANFECAKRRIAEQARETRNEMAQAALDLATLTDTGERQLGQEGVAAGSAAAMGIINQGQAVEKSKLDAGFVRWFIESPAVKEAQKAAAETLEKNLETVQDLKNRGNLTAKQQQKLEEIKEKMVAAKTKAVNCQNASVLPGLFGC